VSVQTANPAATAIVGTDLAGCIVPSLEKSLAFYRDKLGLIPAAESESGAEFHFADGTTFGLWQPPSSEGVDYGFGLLFTVGDARKATELRNRSGAGLSDVSESPVCFMAMGKDPEGNGVILHQRKTPDAHRPPAQARTLTSINGIDIAGYLVKDPQRAIAYYRDVLGLTPTNVDEDGRGAEFELPDGSTFGVWRTPDEAQGGFVMFSVDDARSKVAELRSRGVEMSDVMETPVCIMSFADDPDGNSVIVHQRKKQ
jgi:catechol 2,3-dioxygenase-like lactoylglutathione lyase family enzyme